MFHLDLREIQANAESRQFALEIPIGDLHCLWLGHDDEAAVRRLPVSAQAAQTALQAVAVHRLAQKLPDYENDAGVLAARAHPQRGTLDPRGPGAGTSLPGHGSNGQALASLATPTVDDGAASGGAHAAAEAVLVAALPIAGLESSLHGMALTVLGRNANKPPNIDGAIFSVNFLSRDDALSSTLQRRLKAHFSAPES